MNYTYIFAAILFLFYFLWKLSSLASRLDRTHIRRDNALNSLRQHLALRATCVARIVSSQKMGIEESKRLKAALERLLDESEHSFRSYLSAESALTDLLCNIFENKDSVDLLLQNTQTANVLFDLARACKRVQLARRFHNDAVGASQLLHARSVVRLFRLAGHTVIPTTVDLDDRVPSALASL